MYLFDTMITIYISAAVITNLGAEFESSIFRERKGRSEILLTCKNSIGTNKHAARFEWRQILMRVTKLTMSPPVGAALPNFDYT